MKKLINENNVTTNNSTIKEENTMNASQKTNTGLGELNKGKAIVLVNKCVKMVDFNNKKYSVRKVLKDIHLKEYDEFFAAQMDIFYNYIDLDKSDTRDKITYGDISDIFYFLVESIVFETIDINEIDKFYVKNGKLLFATKDNSTYAIMNRHKDGSVCIFSTINYRCNSEKIS